MFYPMTGMRHPRHIAKSVIPDRFTVRIRILQVAFLIVLAVFAFWKLATALLLIFFFMWYISEDESPVPENDLHVTIIGAGFAGIAMGIRLKKMGVNYTIYEMAPAAGGVWWVNRYPGCECDVPSHLYSLSSDPKPDWTRQFASREEIQQYLQSVANRHELNIVYNTKCESAEWNVDRKMYSIKLSDGRSLQTNILISAVGTLQEVGIPRIPGKFGGKMFHSALWDSSFDYRGKTVAVIGTGASSVQIVPSISLDVDRLYVFQRSPCWSPKKGNFRIPAFVGKIFRVVTPAMWLYRCLLFFWYEFRYVAAFGTNSVIGHWYRRFLEYRIRTVVEDPTIAEKLTPDYAPGCKRITPSDDYLETFNRDNVRLITSPISEFEGNRIKTADGKFYKVDAVVFATGFSPLRSMKSMKMINACYSSTDTDSTPIAYFGMCYEHSPNFFSLLGTNTGLGHNSLIFMAECQVNYVSQTIRYMIRNEEKSISVKASSLEWFKEFLDNHMKKNVFYEGCSSWYKSGDSEHYVLWPCSAVRYWWMTKKFNSNHFDFE